MSFRIASDVPQWVLDEFAKINWVKMGKITRAIAIPLLKKHAAKWIPYKKQGQVYSGSGDTKYIAQHITQDVLDVLNQFDYNSLCQNEQIAVKMVMKKELETNAHLKKYLI